MKPSRRLQLRGTDDAYAQKDAARETRLTAPDPAKLPAAKALDKPDAGAARAGTAKNKRQRAVTPQSGTKATKSAMPDIRVNYRLNLGPALSLSLQRLAEQYDQPMALIMKAARNRALARFRKLAVKNKAPTIPTPEPGGQFTRLSTVFTGEIADNLNRWFDPLKLDIAKDRIKPILIELFQQEAQAICDSVEE